VLLRGEAVFRQKKRNYKNYKTQNSSEFGGFKSAKVREKIVKIQQISIKKIQFVAKYIYKDD
jgi:hypothetical protein